MNQHYLNQLLRKIHACQRSLNDVERRLSLDPGNVEHKFERHCYQLQMDAYQRDLAQAENIVTMEQAHANSAG